MHAQMLSRSARRLIAVLAVSGAAFAQANPFWLVLATEEYPPYNMSGPNGTVTGISTDIVRAVLDAAGYDYEISVYPWARAIAPPKLPVGVPVWPVFCHVLPVNRFAPCCCPPLNVRLVPVG